MSTLLHNNDRGLTPITNALHLTSLYTSLDQLVYLQIAVLYYQDNSFLNLFLRWVATSNFVPPTAAALHRVPVVILLNGICILGHLFGDSPAPATEYSRGYMDGSVFIDFVGEFSHTSKFKLLAEDLLIFAIQILMMVVGNIKHNATAQEPKEPTVAQDIDAEEQGVRRGAEEQEDNNNNLRVTEDGDVELQNLLSGPSSSSSSSSSAVADNLPPIIELNVMHEIRNVIRDNAEMYNRVRAGNEQAIRAVLDAVTAGRPRPVEPTGSTTTDPATNTATV